jgi:subtilisin family serine protease
MDLPGRLCTSVEAARKRPAVWLAGLFLLGLAHAAGAAAPEIRVEPTTLYFGAAAPAAGTTAVSAARESRASTAPRTAVWQALREKAERRGGARVIVRLNVAFAPEGGLASPAAVRRQRTEIDRVQDAVLSRLEGAGARLHARFEYIPFLALEVGSAALERLQALPEVAGIEEDVLEKPSLASSNVVIGSGAALSLGLTGSGKAIAILDTGVDKTHPFFAGGKVVSEACYSSTTDFTTSLCPGGVAESTAPGSGVNCPADVFGCEHGTHVAGIAAGNPGTGSDFGVARDAGIIAIQVFSRDDFVFEAGSFVSDQLKGLERVYALADDFDIAAVNMSLGGGFYSSRESCDFDNPSRKAAIDNLRSIDIATVASSGNDFATDFLSAPACISSAISVGATNDADQVASFSNIASFLDLLAPGVDIQSSVPGGGTASFGGTSMAAPHVAGAWAALKAAHPSATVSDILAILRNTGVSISQRGINDMRRINLGRAVLAGPSATQAFTIHNDGTAVLTVLSLQLETSVPWIKWSPEAPFDLAPGSSKQVTVSVDFNGAPAGESTHRLLVGSTDADENPYPNAVFLVVDKQPCHLLTRTHSGNGSHPAVSPASSSGCPAGQFHAGQAVQLTAAPAAEWAVAGWSGTQNDASTSTANTVTMPAGSHSVSVTYMTPCWALTSTHTGSGADPVATPASSGGCPAGQYHFGETIQLTASPAAGWRIGGWTGTGNDESRLAINVVTMPFNPHTVSVAYLEGIAEILLVDDDDNTPDVRASYTAALDALGVAYDIWSTGNSDNEPDAATLEAYSKVVWFAGDEFGSFAGPGSAGEAALASFLDDGGCLFLSGQDYIFDRGVTPFMLDYLGVGFVSQDIGESTVVGTGAAFETLGPFGLSYPGFNFSDHISPAAGAETVFVGTQGSVGISKIGASYRTIFLGFPFEALPTPTALRQVMGSALEFCATIFADVAPRYWARSWIEAIFHAGITSGCAVNPLRYCPENTVNRDQMAVFLLRAKEGAAYVPPPCTSSPFNDVPVSSPFCPWIQELANRGITGGCGNGSYCPGSPVTREQMAVFLLRTKEGSGYTPAPCETDPFADVADDSFFCPWIRELSNRGITGGCGGGNYCPGSSSTRAQMAVFLVKTFNLPVE